MKCCKVYPFIQNLLTCLEYPSFFLNNHHVLVSFFSPWFIQVEAVVRCFRHLYSWHTSYLLHNGGGTLAWTPRHTFDILKSTARPVRLVLAYLHICMAWRAPFSVLYFSPNTSCNCLPNVWITCFNQVEAVVIRLDSSR